MYRNFNDPQYKKWRKAVYSRDGYKCKYPNCSNRKNLQAHHIFCWASFIEMRFQVTNGITLCKYHHKLVTGREEEFQEMFMKIIRPPDLDVMITMYKMRKK